MLLFLICQEWMASDRSGGSQGEEEWEDGQNKWKELRGTNL